MAKTEKYDYVGHITLPFTNSVKDLFYYTSNLNVGSGVSYKGVEISKDKCNGSLSRFLQGLGYVTDGNEKVTKRSKAVSSVQLVCNNTECAFHSECIKGKCKIGVKIVVEKDRAESSLLLSFKARYVKEVTVKHECLSRYIYEKTGEKGVENVYGKMEMC
jgi:hypothetical protein